MTRYRYGWLVVLLGSIVPCVVAAQDVPSFSREAIPRSHGHVGSSPFFPPEPNDQTFVIDAAPDLDTGCTYRSGGPLVFNLPIGRVVGDVDRLLAEGLVPDTVRLEMPAFDIDSEAVVSGIAPERDRVTFNGNVVPSEFLRGANDTWRQNAFEIPIEWVKFAVPNGNGAPTPGENTIRIDIDTANSGEEWCMSIDWAALSIQAPRPVVFAHGILSNSGTWSGPWTSRLAAWGIPFQNDLNLGRLDSIQDNAAEIRDKVAEYKLRFGVDRVVIVAHSKGGIDSRHFVEQSDDVEQLVQLGTPNAGSPLADLVQAGVVVGLGIGGAVIVNELAGPAGVQLTRPYMAAYNRAHGHNPDVRYTALAGDYDPDCPLLFPICDPVDQALLLITGRGDTIVPVSSVHALSFTQDRDFTSSGDEEDAKHTALTGSSRVLARVQDRVRVPGTPLARAATLGSTTLPQRTTTVAGTVASGGLFVTTIPIDTPGRTFVVLMYPSGQLDLTLESPTGTIIDAAAAAAAGDIEYQDAEFLGGRVALYGFDAMGAGTWTARVAGATVVDPSGATPFTLQAWIEQSVLEFGGVIAEPHRRLGESIVLAADLKRNGAPVATAVVQAAVALPDDSVVAVPLADDGVPPDVVAADGRFSGHMATTTQAGLHRIRFSAESSDPQQPFAREDFGLVTVSASTTSITGVFSEATVDTDGDGFMNELRITVPLDVTVERTYRILGRLRDAAGNVHEAQDVATLPVGPGSLTMRFDGEPLFTNGVNGPYVLESLLLAEEEEIDLLPVREALDAYVTQAYSYEIFEHSPIFLTGNASDVGVDLNANGLYDRLDVSVDVMVETGGFYQWSARLLDASGTELGFDAGSASFAAGTNPIVLQFPGEPIGQNAVDGPYLVRDLLLFGVGQSLLVAQLHTTQAHRAAEFEGAPPTTTTTTIPAGCGTASTYDATRCRIDELTELLASNNARIAVLLRNSLERALAALDRAELAGQQSERVEETLLKRADRRLLGLLRRLASRSAERQLDPSLRAQLKEGAESLRQVIAAL